MEGTLIFNIEVAKIQFNTRTSDLGGFFSVGEVGGHDGVHRHRRRDNIKVEIKAVGCGQ